MIMKLINTIRCLWHLLKYKYAICRLMRHAKKVGAIDDAESFIRALDKAVEERTKSSSYERV